MKNSVSNLVNTIRSTKKWKKILVAMIILLVIPFFIFFITKQKQGSIRDPLLVKKNSVEKSVLASGKVISETDLSLSFQDSNIVKNINVKVGDKVSKGQVLASLSNAPQQAALTRAKGQLLGAEARFRKVIEGASSADIIAAEDSLKNIRRTQERLVENARRTLFSSDLIAEPMKTDMDPLSAPIISGSYTGETEASYNLSFKQSIKDLDFSGPENGRITIYALPQAIGAKGLSISFPSNPSYAFSDEWVVSIPNKKGKNYTANLNAYNAALATRDELVSAAQSRLDVLKTSARRVDIDAANAEVLVAEGGVRSAEADLEKTIIRAPLSGTITKIDVKLGDLVTLNKPVITLQDVEHLYVESNVNESSIIGVSVGQPVNITFEAFGKEKIFAGELSSVDLGATASESVVNYKVRAMLKDQVSVRPGMTADLKIITASAIDTFGIPSRYVQEQGGEKFIWILLDTKTNKVEKRPIETGIRGDGGIIEITRGLSGGETVCLLD